MPPVTDELLLAWLERNAPWLMKLEHETVMDRVMLELHHGELLKRSAEDSLEAARCALEEEYKNGHQDDD